LIEKFDRRKTITAVYFDGEKEAYFTKRFQIENVTDRKVSFIPEDGMAVLELATTQWVPRIVVHYDKRSSKDAGKTEEKFNLSSFAPLKNERGVGSKLTSYKIKQIDLMPPKDGDVPDLPEEDEDLNMDEAKDLYESLLKLSGTDNKPKKGGVDEGEQMNLF